MIDTGDLRKGLIIEHDGTLQRIIDYQHVKQGRGSAFVRLTMRNLRTGSTTQQTFQAGSRFPLVRLERQRVQYLYLEDDTYIFMDLDSFEQLSLTKETLGDAVNYLKEQDTADLNLVRAEVEVDMPSGRAGHGRDLTANPHIGENRVELDEILQVGSSFGNRQDPHAARLRRRRDGS